MPAAGEFLPAAGEFFIWGLYGVEKNALSEQLHVGKIIFGGLLRCTLQWSSCGATKVWGSKFWSSKNLKSQWLWHSQNGLLDAKTRWTQLDIPDSWSAHRENHFGGSFEGIQETFYRRSAQWGVKLVPPDLLFSLKRSRINDTTSLIHVCAKKKN